MMVQAQPTPFFSNLQLFTRVLRASGIGITPTQTSDFMRALEWVDLGERDQVFHAARSMLINRKEHLALFEVIFNVFWRKRATKSGIKGQKAPLAPRHKRPPQHQYAAMLMARAIRSSDKEIELIDKSATYSASERLQQKDFGHMTEDELEAVKKMMQKMRWQVSLRQTRRRVADRHGSTIDLRRGMRDLVKYGGIPLALSYQTRKIKQRPVILLADISGSMDKYSRLVLQFFYSLSQMTKMTESFVFGTRLTRITNELKLKNIDKAIDQSARAVIDWHGGTRIGDSLAEFNRTWSKRVLRRGAIVILISDGWERGDATNLSQEMRYLQRRCHRLIWLNPLSGKVGYEPKVEGMAACLPFVDDFLPIHNLQSLQQLATHLEYLDERSIKP